MSSAAKRRERGTFSPFFCGASTEPTRRQTLGSAGGVGTVSCGIAGPSGTGTVSTSCSWGGACESGEICIAAGRAFDGSDGEFSSVTKAGGGKVGGFTLSRIYDKP